jgi:hypothetical protein
MANSVVETNEIFLNGVYYPTTRPVRSTLASIYPAKVVIGDTTKDSQLRASIIAWSDWRGGIGVNRMEGGGETSRAWYSTCQLRYKNHLVLPGLVTESAIPAHGLADATIGAINTLSDEVYAFWNGSISESPKLYKYNNTGDVWNAETQSALDRVTDSIIFTNAIGVTYLVFAHYDTNGSGYTHKSDYTTTLDGAINASATSVAVADASGLVAGEMIKVDSEHMLIGSISSNTLTVTRARNSTAGASHLDAAAVSVEWTTDTTGTKFVTTWDERLWGISHDGQLWYATVVGTEVNDAVLPLPDGSVTALFVARNALGIPIIYAATTRGLFAHNADNAMWESTQMDFPVHPDNGKGTLTWRDSVYIPSGNGIYKYINGNNAAVITIMGPDRDDGLPADSRGAIRNMAGSHNELLVGIDASAAPATISSTSIPYQWISHQGSTVIPPNTGFSSILGYNDMGWEVKWQSGTEGKGFDSIHVSNAYSKYRVWWGHNDIVHFMDLPKDIINPSEVSEFAYAKSGIHETPWFNAGQSEVDKLALNLRIEAQDLTYNASSTADTPLDEFVKVEYATNYSESYTTAVGKLDSNTMDTGASGTHIYTFASGVGTGFRAIKFKLTLYRSAATSTGLEKFNTPDVVSLTLEYRKKITAKWGHTVDVDLTNEYKGNVPKDLRSNLISAIESTTLVEFTFRDDSGGTRNYYVDVIGAQGMEFTGHDERGSTTIQVVEP